MVLFDAAIASSKGPKNGKLYTEDDWNETATLEESPYLLSKVSGPAQALQRRKQSACTQAHPARDVLTLHH